MIRPARPVSAAAVVLALTLSPLAAQAPADIGGGGAPSADAAPSASVSSSASPSLEPSSAPAALSLAAAPSAGAGEAPPAADPTAPSAGGPPPVLPPPPEAPLPPQLPPTPALPAVPPVPPVPPVSPVPPAPPVALDPFTQGQREGASDRPAPTLTLRAGAAPAITVQVRPGESITSIGRRFGVSAGAIMAANHSSNDLLRVGQNLIIPVQPAPTPEVLQPLIAAAPGAVLAGPENIPVTPAPQAAPQPMPVIPGFAFAPGAAPAAAAPPLPQPMLDLAPPVPDSPLLHDTRFDINFENRPAGEVATMLMERVAGINIMLPGETGNIIIPSLSLKEVNLAEFMAALTAASQADMSSGNDGYSLDPVPGAPNILIFRQIQIHRTVTAAGYGAGGPGGSGVAASYPGAPARIHGMGPDVRGRTPAVVTVDPSVSLSSAPSLRGESRKGGGISVGGGRVIPGAPLEEGGGGFGGSGNGTSTGTGPMIGAPGGMPGATGAPGLGGGAGSGFGSAGFGGAGSGAGMAPGGYGGGPAGGAAAGGLGSGEGAFGGGGGGYGDGGMAMAGAPYQGRSESAFLDLSTILGSSDLKVDDITTAIRTAWSSIEGEKTPPEGALKFHQETKLLIITATPEYLNAATSIVALLQSRSEPSQDQKDQALADMKRQLGEALDSRARLMKDLDNEMDKLRQSREVMQAKVAELEIELLKRSRAGAAQAPEGKATN